MSSGDDGEGMNIDVDTSASAIVWVIFLTALLCWGEPDLYDAIITFLTKG
jgi:hypothetical protein